ncbi:MAG: hypothetical protein KDC53_13105, partial [Saprospiraceae bacterium]|nr:hypothetical protein [Saprospiraceae bacterium]
QSQKITLTQSFSTLLGGGVNVWAKAQAGVDIFSLKIWGEIGASLDISGSTTTTDDFVLEMESSQRFETSDDQNVVGPRGDVFVGAAINLVYAKADILEFDLKNCALVLDTVIMVDNDGFQTEFVYTDGHIRNTVIPNLQDLYDNAAPNDNMARFEAMRSIKVWEQVLELNEELKAEALMQDTIGNVSFNSGDGAITRSYTESSTQTRTIEFQTIIDATIAAEAGFEIAGSGLSGGVAVNFRTEIGKASSSSVSTSTTTGYVFDDDDNSQNGTNKDDSWTVDVVTDPVYGTPVFKLRAGETSCPWEEGTAKRFKPVMTVTNPIIYAAPGVDEVTFQFQLSNQSETDEAGNYTLELVNASNPGAIVTINGANFTANVINFHPLSKGTIFRNVKVKRDLGTSDFAYEGLRFLFYPTCARDEAVAVSISAFFDNPCSDIVLSAPGNNWVVNNIDNNQKAINITGYDLNSNFSEVRMEYALPGENVWNSTNIILSKNQLSSNPSGTTVNWNTTGINDGAYDIRLRLQCGTTFNFSERKTGIIDRAAPVVYGVQQPLDDNYVPGDEISVYFNEKIQCNQLSNANLTLKMIPQNTVVLAQLSCDDRRITVVPLEDIFPMVNQQFEVEISGVEDLYGNVMSSPIRWTFAVGDPDSDGDGVADSDDRCPGGNDYIDSDLGGTPDDCDCNILNPTNDGIDDDCDDIINYADLCPGVVDASLDFDGIDDHIIVPHQPDLNVLEGDFTFTAWVHPNYDSRPKTILSKGVSIWILSIYQNKIALFVNGQWLYSDTDVPTETWSHVAVSYNHSSNNLSFYLNGAPDGIKSYSVPVTSNNDTLPMYIARQGHNCNCNFFWGGLDEMSIWSKALDATEIMHVMTNTSSKHAPGLVAAYGFNDSQPYVLPGSDTLSETTKTHPGSLVNFEVQTILSRWRPGSNKIENCLLCTDILELSASMGTLEGIYEAGSEIRIKTGTIFSPGKNVTLYAPTISMEPDVTVPQTTVLNINQSGCNE